MIVLILPHKIVVKNSVESDVFRETKIESLSIEDIRVSLEFIFDQNQLTVKSVQLVLPRQMFFQWVHPTKEFDLEVKDVLSKLTIDPHAKILHQTVSYGSYPMIYFIFKDLLDPLVEFFHERKIQVEGVYLKCPSLIFLDDAFYQQYQEIVQGDEIKVLVHVDEKHTEVFVFQNNRLVNSRTFLLGQDFIDNDLWRKNILKKIDQIGSDFDLPIEDVDFTIIDLDETILFDSSLNFLPEDIHILQQQEQTLLKCKKAMGVLIVTIIGFALVVWIFLYQSKSSLVQQQNKMQQTQTQMDLIDQKMNWIEQWNNQKDSPWNLTALFEIMGQHFGEEIGLQSLQLESEKAVVLIGRSQRANVMTRVQTKLLKHEQIDQVDLLYLRPKRIQDNDVEDFKMKVSLKTNVEEQGWCVP